MNNLLASLKRLLGNKNTVTIIGVLIGVAVILIGYNYRVNNAVQPVEVPYATQRIVGKTRITSEMVGTIKVSQSFIDETPDLYTSINDLRNGEKYVNYDTVIPQGALFYKTQVVEKKDIPDSAFDDIPDGYTIFSLSVDLHSTYGNSIMPDNFIDLYMKAVDDNGLLIFGKFIESIKVLAVRDSGGNDVFVDSQATRSPSELLFAVPDDLFLLLSKADNLTTNNITIVPVPRNKAFTDKEGATEVTSDQLQEMIISKSVVVQQNETNPNSTTDDNSTNNNNNNNNNN